MKRRRVSFVTRRSRAAGAAAGMKSWVYAARRSFLTAIVIVALIFALNLIVKYVFEHYDIRAKLGQISLMAKPRYFIIKDNYYTLYTNGKTEFIDGAYEKTLPVLTGVKLEEDREGHKKALEQALGIKGKYLENISEINMRNPENIILITVEGKKIYAGNSLTNKKMRNFYITLKLLNKN